MGISVSLLLVHLTEAVSPMRNIFTRINIIVVLACSGVCTGITTYVYETERARGYEPWSQYQAMIRDEQRRVRAEKEVMKAQLSKKLEGLRAAGFKNIGAGSVSQPIREDSP